MAYLEDEKFGETTRFGEISLDTAQSLLGDGHRLKFQGEFTLSKVAKMMGNLDKAIKPGEFVELGYLSRSRQGAAVRAFDYDNFEQKKLAEASKHLIDLLWEQGLSSAKAKELDAAFRWSQAGVQTSAEVAASQGAVRALADGSRLGQLVRDWQPLQKKREALDSKAISASQNRSGNIFDDLSRSTVEIEAARAVADSEIRKKSPKLSGSSHASSITLHLSPFL